MADRIGFNRCECREGNRPCVWCEVAEAYNALERENEALREALEARIVEQGTGYRCRECDTWPKRIDFDDLGRFVREYIALQFADAVGRALRGDRDTWAKRIDFEERHAEADCWLVRALTESEADHG